MAVGEITIDTDPASKTIRLTFRTPDQALDFTGDLDALKCLVKSRARPFAEVLSPEGRETLTLKLLGIVDQIEAEFQEAGA